MWTSTTSAARDKGVTTLHSVTALEPSMPLMMKRRPRIVAGDTMRPFGFHMEVAAMKHVVLPSLLLALATSGFAQEFTEPKTSVRLPLKSADGQMALLGAGVRSKTFVVKVKVYVAALYVTPEALAKHKGKAPTPELFTDLVWGDFPKEITLRFVRNVGKDRIQSAMREALPAADKALTDRFVSYFPEVKEGQECVLRWGSGGVLEVTMAGEKKAPIADKNFAAAVFGIYLGEKPIQDDLKLALVARASEVLK